MWKFFCNYLNEKLLTNNCPIFFKKFMNFWFYSSNSQFIWTLILSTIFKLIFNSNFYFILWINYKNLLPVLLLYSKAEFEMSYKNRKVTRHKNIVRNFTGRKNKKRNENKKLFSFSFPGTQMKAKVFLLMNIVLHTNNIIVVYRISSFRSI